MKSYLKLIRPYGMLFLGFTPVFGAIANGEFKLPHLFILFIIGLLAHIFTFVQNDYFDVDVDSKSKYVSNRPLATGSISQKTVFIIFLSSFILSLVLVVGIFFSLQSFLVLLTSFLFITLYNKYSKHFLGMEYVLSIGIFTFGIFGALTVSNNISYLAIIISAVGFIQWLFSVGVSANLKDVEYDSKIGIRTTPMVFGVQVSDKSLRIPIAFSLYVIGLKIIHILIVSLPFLLGYTSIFIFGLPIPGIYFLTISLALLYITIKILSTPLSKRDKMLIYMGLQEGLALLLIPITLMSHLIENIKILPTLFLILLLILWPLFSFRMLFGKRMIPLE
ncbi:MAG: UbiA prenyltransferase family protein [Thermoplasmatales archaeon]|nr:MAG: UbiA prenyltransferase family protein [Thermoplasmatales archaeon]